MSITQLLQRLTPATLAEVEPYSRSTLSAMEDYARLDAMEAPYSFKDLPADLQQTWLEKISNVEANRYPPQLSQTTIDKLHKFLKIPESLSFIAGNGSDELIMLLMLLCGTARGGRVLSPSPSFSMYRHLTKALGGEFIEVDLEEDFTLDQNKFIEAIKKHKPQLIFLAQPNNPSGKLFSAETINIAAELLKDSGLVVVDRAYEFFLKQEDVLADYTKHANLINLYTLSKIGFAGLRFGFAVANKEIIYELSKLRLPYNINSLTCASIEVMADNLDCFRQYADNIVEGRDELMQQLGNLEQIQVFQSCTNFILLRLLGSKSSSACVKYLQQHKVLVKDFSDYHPLMHNCLRVSIGKPEENSLFLKNLTAYIQDDS